MTKLKSYPWSFQHLEKVCINESVAPVRLVDCVQPQKLHLIGEPAMLIFYRIKRNYIGKTLEQNESKWEITVSLVQGVWLPRAYTRPFARLTNQPQSASKDPAQSLAWWRDDPLNGCSLSNWGQNIRYFLLRLLDLQKKVRGYPKQRAQNNFSPSWKEAFWSVRFFSSVLCDTSLRFYLRWCQGEFLATWTIRGRGDLLILKLCKRENSFNKAQLIL